MVGGQGPMIGTIELVLLLVMIGLLRFWQAENERRLTVIEGAVG